METYLSSGARWLLVVVVVCWLVTDARPAPAAWLLLRRQKAPNPRPFPEP
jgi:hypothetical protein